MTTIVRTEIIVTTNDTDYQVPGDMTPQAVITAYSASIPGLSNMVFEERVEYRADLNGNVRVITFKPRTGTKGAVVRTEIIVTTNDTDYQVPGDMTPQAVITAYSASIPGLSNMVYEERVEYRQDLGGEVRVITFKPRTGTKG